VEDHEVGEEDLVHASPGLEAVQVVVGALRLDVSGLAGQRRRCRMNAFSPGCEDSRDRVLRQPIDLEIGVQPPQLLCNGNIPAGVAQADR
jgi:hypothetical protein